MSILLGFDDDYLFYLLALKAIPNIGVTKSKRILNTHIHPKKLFTLPFRQICHDFSLSASDAKAILEFNDFKSIEEELKFIQQKKVELYFYQQEQYPQQLQKNEDAPFLLFSFGKLSLAQKKRVAIIGTRKNTEYGRKMTEQIVKFLAPYDVVIISGLATGIDSIAHQSALDNQLTTIAVLGHGLNMIYPHHNIPLAKNILQQKGVLLTEFFSTIRPSKETFPIRNRIVAGLCDVLIVIETGKKGGSLITANYANEYNKEVFAVPGRMSDEKSEGCHALIYSHKAFLLNEANDIIEMMNWGDKAPTKTIQPSLFVSLNSNQQKIMQIIQQEGEKTHLDKLITISGIPFSLLSSELLELEFNGLIKSLPGKFYVCS